MNVHWVEMKLWNEVVTDDSIEEISFDEWADISAAVVRHLQVLESAATRVAENYVIGADLAGFLVLANIPHHGDGCRADAVYSV